MKGSHTLIVPYVSQLLGSLMKLLNDQSSAVVGATLSTIGELALASPASVSEHLDVVFPRLIDLLNDSGSINKQEVAVVAMGKLVSSLTMVTEEPYTKFPGLFAALAKAIQNPDDASSSVRLQAMRTMGLLGNTTTFNTSSNTLSNTPSKDDALTHPLSPSNTPSEIRPLKYTLEYALYYNIESPPPLTHPLTPPNPPSTGTVGEKMYQTHLSDQGGVVDAFGAQTDHIEDEAEEAVASSSLAGEIGNRRRRHTLLTYTF